MVLNKSLNYVKMSINLQEWFGEEKDSSPKSGIILIYPNIMDWWQILLPFVKNLPPDKVCIYTRHTRNKGYNCGVGIGNLDKVSDESKLLSTYTVSMEHKIPMTCKYLIYPVMSELPHNIPLIPGRHVIIMANWHVDSDEITKLEKLSFQSATISMENQNTSYNFKTKNITISKNDSLIYKKYNKTYMKMIITNFNFGSDFVSKYWDEWNKSGSSIDDIDDRIEYSEAIKEFIDEDTKSPMDEIKTFSPKLFDIISDIKINGGKHIIMCSYNKDYGLYTISYLLNMANIKHSVSSTLKVNSATIETFSNNENGILVTSHLPDRDIYNVSNLWIFDCPTWRLIKDWLNFIKIDDHTKKKEVVITTFSTSLYSSRGDQRSKIITYDEAMSSRYNQMRLQNENILESFINSQTAKLLIKEDDSVEVQLLNSERDVGRKAPQVKVIKKHSPPVTSSSLIKAD